MSIDAHKNPLGLSSSEGPAFTSKPLRSSMLSANPLKQFATWYREAEKECRGYPNPIQLATVGADGQPVARTVLLKGFDEGGFCFFTNYRSRKGQHLESNPKASFCLYWEELERQVIVIGTVHKLTGSESDQYFGSRPRGSQLSAHVSEQSQVVENRTYLKNEFQRIALRYADSEVPRPRHWGGYRLAPLSIEFWQGQPDRLHDRFIYQRSGAEWHLQRLAP